MTAATLPRPSAKIDLDSLIAETVPYLTTGYIVEATQYLRSLGLTDAQIKELVTKTMLVAD